MKTSNSDISTDTGKLVEALTKLDDPEQAALLAATNLEQLNNPALAARFRRAVAHIQAETRKQIGYLQAIDRNPIAALRLAITGFRKREGRSPVWAAASDDVTLPADELQKLGLQPAEALVRPGYVLVGIDQKEERLDRAI